MDSKSSLSRPPNHIEKPQEGSQRSLNQIGAELFGSRDPLADSEIGAKVEAQYATLGPYDIGKFEEKLINEVEGPDSETIAKIVIEFGSKGTIYIGILAAIR